jgi:hypothetical protein
MVSSGPTWLSAAIDRRGPPCSSWFSVIAGAIDISGQAIIDWDVVVIHEGRTNFSELQAGLPAGRQDRLVFYAFSDWHFSTSPASATISALGAKADEGEGRYWISVLGTVSDTSIVRHRPIIVLYELFSSPKGVHLEQRARRAAPGGYPCGGCRGLLPLDWVR